MMIGLVQPGTSRGTFRQMIGSRNTTPPRMLRMVPFGDFHISFKPNSFTRASSGVMVAHLTPTPTFLMALAASTVTWSLVLSRYSIPRSKYISSISRNGRISLSLMNCQMIRVISSPSSSTTGLATLIFFMARNSSKTVAVEMVRGGSGDHSHAPPSTQAQLGGAQPERSDQPGLRLEDRLVGRGERLHKHVDGLDHLEQRARSARGETLLYDMIDERLELLPIAGNVDDDDRLVMQQELLPGDDFKRFLNRADPAGEDGEGVGPLEHELLALVHAADDDQLVDAVVADFTVIEMRGNDAGDPATGLQYGVGEPPHETDPAAAIDELDARAGEPRPELDSRLAIDRIDPVGCAAIDAKPLHYRHSCSSSRMDRSFDRKVITRQDCT